MNARAPLKLTNHYEFVEYAGFTDRFIEFLRW